MEVRVEDPASARVNVCFDVSEAQTRGARRRRLKDRLQTVPPVQVAMFESKGKASSQGEARAEERISSGDSTDLGQIRSSALRDQDEINALSRRKTVRCFAVGMQARR